MKYITYDDIISIENMDLESIMFIRNRVKNCTNAVIDQIDDVIHDESDPDPSDWIDKFNDYEYDVICDYIERRVKSEIIRKLENELMNLKKIEA